MNLIRSAGMLFAAAFAFACQAEPEMARFEIHSLHETWKLPENETMGLFALGVRKRLGEHARFGVDFYDAIEGQRGGFITLGLSGGIVYPLSDRWHAQAEVHVGAGGGNGGYFLTRGGLMLRESCGLKFDLNAAHALGLGWSQVRFPEGGSIRSAQFYVSYDHSFTGIFLEGRPVFAPTEVATTRWPDYQGSLHQPALIVRNVVVPASVKRLDGQPQAHIQQVGAEWKSFLDTSNYFRMETVGAMGGNSSGYMHVMAGAGSEYRITEDLAVEAFLNLGGGGGGAVDTGGGLMGEAGVGMRQALFDRWFVKATAGRIVAFHGDFRGTSYLVGVGRSFGRGHGQQDVPIVLDSVPLRMRIAHQTYTGTHSDWRTRPEQNVDNLGVQIDYFISPQFFLSGQGLAAYAGDAGAYMTGLVGAGYRMALTQDWFAETELLAGAAGGGGLAAGSGLVRQVNLGVSWQLSEAFSLQAGIGNIRAANGTFAALSRNISLNYNFNLMSLR